MIDIKDRLKGVTDTGQWAARGASFVAKAKATKAVWFPPEPVATGKKAASTATRATKKAAEKPGGAARKTGGAGKKTAAAAKKTTSSKKVSSPAGRKKA